MLFTVQLGFWVSLRRSLWEKASSGFRYAQREKVSRKAPSRHTVSKAVRFSFMVSPPKTEKYRKG